MHNSLKLYEIILTNPTLLNHLENPSKLQVFEDFKSETARLFRAAEPTFPEHQLRFLMDEIFTKEKNYVQLLLDSFKNFSSHFFTWHFGEIRFQREAVLEWVENFSTHLTTLPLMAFLIADFSATQKNISSQLIHDIFRGPVIPFPNDFSLDSLLQQGLVETHLHFNGSAIPTVLWENILKLSPKWLIKTHKDSNQKKLWQQNLPEIPPSRLNLLLKLAKWIRDWLGYWAAKGDFHNSGQDVAQSLSDSLRAQTLLDLPPAPTGIARHPGTLLPGGHGENLIIAEAALWVHTFKRLMSQPCSLAGRMLHIYHLIMSAVITIMVHQQNMKGFYLFDTLSGLSLRGFAESEKNAARDRLVQLHRTSCLKGLEARISLKEDYYNTVENKVKPLVKAYTENRTKHSLNFELGIIFHFIKKQDQNRRIKPPFGSQYFFCRHEQLRNSLVRQASVIERIRRLRRDFGKFIVGVDGAGNELKTPPEVFAPVFRHIMSELNHNRHHSIFTHLSGDDQDAIPPLKFTFHVGEEFHHLLSGLRAVDEAITFMNLPSGSRLGHALALGFDPRLWHERSQTTRLPRLEWLDNLVWFYHHLNGFPEFKLRLADEIRRYSVEVYKDNLSPRLLHQAWQFRELGWTSMEKNLPSQETRSEELHKHLPNQAFTLAESYHYDIGVWERGREIIQADFKKEYIDDWINALKFVQEKLTQQVFKQQIAIEACPLSNLRISQIRKLREHPVFRWHHPNPDSESPRVYVLVATDNTGIFQTSLPLEYSALTQAAEDTENLPDTRQTAEWLEIIRGDTERYSFLGNPRRSI